MYIPDPLERMESKVEDLMDNYLDENTCMQCKKKVDYDLICPDPMGMGPAICVECLGFDPFESPELVDKSA